MTVASGTIEFLLVRSPDRRATIGMRVMPGGAIVVRAPLRLASRTVDEFVESKADWIARQREKPVPAPEAALLLEDGGSVHVRGEQLEIRVELGGRRTEVTREDGVLRVAVTASQAGRPGVVARTVLRWLSAEALADVEAASVRWAPTIGAQPGRVLLSNARHRWGSCGSDGVVRVNWRVVAVKPELLDYVVVHELCHLLEHNHSPQFWARVAAALPDHKARRAALRKAEPLLSLA